MERNVIAIIVMLEAILPSDNSEISGNISFNVTLNCHKFPSKLVFVLSINNKFSPCDLLLNFPHGKQIELKDTRPASSCKLLAIHPQKWPVLVVLKRQKSARENFASTHFCLL
jgi:hypothetical protein